MSQLTGCTNQELLDNYHKYGIAVPYIPLLVSASLDGDPAYYVFEGEKIPVNQADAAFWARVEAKYPTQFVKP